MNTDHTILTLACRDLQNTDKSLAASVERVLLEAQQTANMAAFDLDTDHLDWDDVFFRTLDKAVTHYPYPVKVWLAEQGVVFSKVETGYNFPPCYTVSAKGLSGRVWEINQSTYWVEYSVNGTFVDGCYVVFKKDAIDSAYAYVHKDGYVD